MSVMDAMTPRQRRALQVEANLRHDHEHMKRFGRCYLCNEEEELTCETRPLKLTDEESQRARYCVEFTAAAWLCAACHVHGDPAKVEAMLDSQIAGAKFRLLRWPQ